MFINNKTLDVFWCPYWSYREDDWNILYNDLENLYSDLEKNKNKLVDKKNNLFLCPVVRNFTKNTFVIKNPIKSHIEIVDNKIIYKSINYIDSKIARPPSLDNNILVNYGISYIFFCEENLNMALTSPFFSNSQHLKYGSIVPGKFDISSWFRNINFEYNLWNNEKTLIIEKDEDIAYVNFETEKNVNLIRFNLSDKLNKYAASCGTSTRWETFVPLIDRYKRFLKSRTNKLVLKEIKKNLVK